MSRDFDPRLLRAFVATAEELHFTRAASRLYVAQQALSRDIRRLERDLGEDLFIRTTRQVRLTSEGARLLPYARQVLAAHEAFSAAASVRKQRPLLVDVGDLVTTGYQVLEETRRTHPELELVARFHSGLTGAAQEILDGSLDASFGRFAGLAPAVAARLTHRPVRFERMAVLLPEDHALCAHDHIPLKALAGRTLYAAAGNQSAVEWTDLASQLFAGYGIHLAEQFPEIEGPEEFMRVVRKRGWWVLASTEFIKVPGMALRLLSDPVPLSPLSLVWRTGLDHPALDALVDTVRRLAEEHHWLDLPSDAWLPPEDRAAMQEGDV
ncbi:LysR family transcriptional regulator [Streptomyces candidus]|uniref:DNA-binding transcriptional LysR family regulator n=1 Tax=Streptomyces candidus TaxID=67283 RepID=A0A7X0HLG2_9ACTN|nr:LysR family transcriptional regulator [Streptomyces candidus]MBB6439851.1 DNA-binding transcriptional LysR family regulator [Streptomyces candidus]GHH55918.1 LysR family transcriptional regulator [Streptomyces candidus]